MTLLMTTGSLTIAAGAVIFLVITLILVGDSDRKHFAGWFAKWWYLLVFSLWWWW